WRTTRLPLSIFEDPHWQPADVPELVARLRAGAVRAFPETGPGVSVDGDRRAGGAPAPPCPAPDGEGAGETGQSWFASDCHDAWRYLVSADQQSCPAPRSP